MRTRKLKRKSFAKTKKQILFPGEQLKNKIETGEPKINGQYLCWVKPFEDEAIDWFPLAYIRIINFNEGQFMSGEIVLGWFGPLPVLSQDELDNYLPAASGLTLFFIGTKERAKLNRFEHGPFYRPIQYVNIRGNENLFVFQVNSRLSSHKIIKQWESKNNRWVEYIQKKYNKKYPNYAVCTVKQLIANNHQVEDDIVKCLCQIPNDTRYYIWELSRKNKNPLHKWTTGGWVHVSDKRKLKINKRIK